MFKWLVKSGNYTLLRLKSDMLCQSGSTMHFMSLLQNNTIKQIRIAGIMVKATGVEFGRSWTRAPFVSNQSL